MKPKAGNAKPSGKTGAGGSAASPTTGAGKTLKPGGGKIKKGGKVKK